MVPEGTLNGFLKSVLRGLRGANCNAGISKSRHCLGPTSLAVGPNCTGFTRDLKVDEVLPELSTPDERRSIGGLGISDRRTSLRAGPVILPEHENTLNADSIDSTQNLLRDFAWRSDTAVLELPGCLLRFTAKRSRKVVGW